MALLNGFDRLATSGVKVAHAKGSSAASSSESMLKELSDIAQPGLKKTSMLGFVNDSFSKLTDAKIQV